MKTLDLAYTPEEDLVYAQESIASALALGLDGFTMVRDKLKECFPSILRGFNANEDLTKLPKFEDLSRKEKEFLKEIEGLNYTQLREYKAYVPEGLTGTYLEYATALRQSVEHLKYIVPNVLMPYLTFLGHIVSDKKARIATTDNSKFYDNLDKDRQASYKAQAQFFSDKHHNAESKVGKVIARNSDWPEVFALMKHLVTDLKMADRDKIKNVVKQCSDYLEIIYTYLNGEEMTNVSPEVSQALARGAFTIAQELEYFSIIYYRVLALESSIDRTTNKIQEIINK